MSNQCILTGFFPLRKDVTKAQVEEALLANLEPAQTGLSQADIKALMKADSWADEHLSVSPGSVDIALNFRGTAGHHSALSEAMGKAFDSLVEGPSWLLATDLEAQANRYGAVMMYPVGPTPQAKSQAKALYGLSLAESALESAGLDREAKESLKAWVLANISGADSALQVSLDGGETFLPAREGVRVIVKEQGSEEDPVDLHLNVTHEGVVMDLWAGDDLVGTEAALHEDIVGRLYDAGDDAAPERKEETSPQGCRPA